MILKNQPISSDEQTELSDANRSVRSVLQEFAPAIETELERLTRFDTDCPQLLKEAIRYSLLAPGKRIRPSLVMIANRVCGGDGLGAISAACAVEMIHCYSLIHDDLPAMDDDDFRRGRPSCHKQFDEATAILAADALQALAYHTLAVEIEDSKISQRCAAALAGAAGASMLVGGQVDDLANEKTDSNEWTVESLEHIHLRKTGALLTVSLELGGIVADADLPQIQALKNYGKNLGLAFQITDDLLDLQGDPEKTGKSAGKDIKQQKLTYPNLLGENESFRKAQELIERAKQDLSVFGDSAKPLAAIADFVLTRQH